MTLAVPAADVRAFVHLLAANLTWGQLAVLQRGDAQPDELSAAIGQPLNAVSQGLEQLAGLGIVARRTSDADSTRVYYQQRAFTRTLTELAQRIRHLLVFIARDQRAIAEEVA